MKRQELTKVSEKLSEFVETFASQFGRSERRHWAKLYLFGLLLEGERKSIQPLAQRIEGGNAQSMQQFITDSPWDSFSLFSGLSVFMIPRLPFSSSPKLLLLDDSSCPKKGNDSVGVERQYCGALGKIDNCQSFVSWQYSWGDFHLPLLARLYLPQSWCSDKLRMDKVGIPLKERHFQEKWKIALNLLDSLHSVEFEAIAFDTAYGNNRVFLRELDQRGHSFVGQVQESETFWDGELSLEELTNNQGKSGPPRKHYQIREKGVSPKSAKKWAEELFSEKKNIKTFKLPRQKGERKIEYVSKQVYETIRLPFRRVGAKRGLIIEKLEHGSYKYYVSNLLKKKPKEVLEIGKRRWEIEQGYQQFKEELGLDHYEGRSWQGFHHHLAMCFMVYDFLQLLRLETQKKRREDHFPSNEKPFQRNISTPRLSKLPSSIAVEADSLFELKLVSYLTK